MERTLTHVDAVRFFAELYGGEHHIPAPGQCGSHGVRMYGGGGGWYVNHFGDLSTFDFDKLTRLVFLAHDRCVRAIVKNGGPRMVKIVIWNRDKREGSIWECHPTLETAVSRHRAGVDEGPLMPEEVGVMRDE